MLVLIGPTCSGKDTLTKELCKYFGFVRVLEHTTRTMREGEANGKDYWFVSNEEFKKLVDNGDLIGVREFNRYQNGKNETVYYGTNKNNMFTSPQNILTTNIGAAKLLKQHAYDLDLPLYIIGIQVDEDIQRERLAGRNDDPQEIEKRLATDKIAYADLDEIADHIIVNNGDKSISALAIEVSELYDDWCKG